MDVVTQQQLNLSQNTVSKLAKLQLNTLSDLILHLPLRYEDKTKLTTLKEAQIGEKILIEGTIIKQEVLFITRKQLLLHVIDAQNDLFLIRLFHFYPNQVKLYTKNTKIRAFGELKSSFFGLEMIHPNIQTHFSSSLQQHLTPIYPSVKGLSQTTLSNIINRALEIADLTDYLPDSLLKDCQLMDFKSAIFSIHHPKSQHVALYGKDWYSTKNPAMRRLKFDELLAQQLSMALIKIKRNENQKPVLKFKQTLAQKLIKSLPFKLTGAQKRVLKELKNDLKETYPMHRLLQGDVGSGKTIVAALISLMVIEGGYQVALIAPTELLAEQHFKQISTWFNPLALKIAYLSGSQTKKQKEKIKQAIVAGDYHMVVGTHALIQEDVQFKQLELMIVDEQHRFGVKQRLSLKEKGNQVHQLMMSATPIPRTLSMTYYADVNLSIIDELPPNRTPVKTILAAEHRREEIEQFVAHKIKQGRQAYWVCPLIDESEALELQTAIETHKNLQLKFPNFNVGLVHGKLKSQEKTEIMTAFNSNQIQLLVATTVIEVGVNVPNASTMVIEHSERLGLSQLHQLRGRVGRGENIESECILIYQVPLTEVGKKRLKVLHESNDGFEIARQDLIIRGPGEFLGAKQSGIPLLRFADINEDIEPMIMAKEIAKILLQCSDPANIEQHINRWLPIKEGYLGV